MWTHTRMHFVGGQVAGRRNGAGYTTRWGARSERGHYGRRRKASSWQEATKHAATHTWSYDRRRAEFDMTFFRNLTRICGARGTRKERHALQAIASTARYFKQENSGEGKLGTGRLQTQGLDHTQPRRTHDVYQLKVARRANTHKQTHLEQCVACLTSTWRRCGVRSSTTSAFTLSSRRTGPSGTGRDATASTT
jgi:hypothetical protein